MPTQRNWKTYYTTDEAHKIVHDYIRESAEDLRKEFKEIKLKYKEEVYV
jgi:hypothetical protein